MYASVGLCAGLCVSLCVSVWVVLMSKIPPLNLKKAKPADRMNSTHTHAHTHTPRSRV